MKIWVLNPLFLAKCSRPQLSPAVTKRGALYCYRFFDESFPVANKEDTEHSYCLCAAGHRLKFNPETVVYQLTPNSFLKYFRIKVKRGYWRMVVYRNYPQKAFRDTYTPVVIKLQTLAAALLLAALLSFAFPKMLTVAARIFLGILLSSLSFFKKTFKKVRPSMNFYETD